ncbi:MAG: hypothetical protein QOG13_1617 [Sphingomonadales bacterium]|nr:hypothetical protein [Sphingomonadales bacterium]MEA3042342.1 hypothetical protein [Sphingomonadales bacterium]
MKTRLLAERPLPRDGIDRRRKTKAVRTVTVNLAESPLGWLRSRGLVSARQFEAAEKLRGDWERGGLEPAVTMRWDAMPRDKAARRAPAREVPTMSQIAARRRFDAAAAAVGAGLTDLLWRVVCAGEGMREAERAFGWPARAGRVVLGIALERLADHYRMR